MIGAVTVSHLLGEARFVECGIVEGDGARIDRCVRRLRHHRDHGTRIDPARQERTERHFGNHAQADRLAQAADQFFLRLHLVDGDDRAEIHVPVAARRRRDFSAPDAQAVCRFQFERLTVDGARIGDIAEREVFLDGMRIECERQTAV